MSADVEFAEEAVLGIILNHPDAAGEVFARVPVDAFSGRNVLIAEAINGLRVKREHIDHATVSGELLRRGTLSRVGAEVPTKLWSGYSVREALPSYLDVVIRAMRLRNLSAIGNRLAVLSEADEADPLTLAQRARDAAQAVIDAYDAEVDVSTMTLGEFLDVEESPYDWVIPGLLERGDRLLLTGAEGLGKSTLFQQLAVCIAAGVHPFTGRSMPSQRALIVDCENGPTHMRRKLRALAQQARVVGSGADSSLFVESRPEGLNLLDQAQAAWLVGRVAALQPAVLFTGSLYKLMEADPNKEEPARQVAAVLDRCRAVANCCVVVEAHSGHSQDVHGKRQVRPIGASMWLRWPEFGYGLRRVPETDPEARIVELVGWRGDRDEREWPQRLKAGGVWPWAQAAVEWRAAS
jgi:replicative DNA helicase